MDVAHLIPKVIAATEEARAALARLEAVVAELDAEGLTKRAADLERGDRIRWTEYGDPFTRTVLSAVACNNTGAPCVALRFDDSDIVVHVPADHAFEVAPSVERVA